MKKVLLTSFVLAVYVAHQDYWNWGKSDYLVLGFLPVGLAYHAAYSILCAAMMGLLVACAWPKHLEEQDPPAK